MRNWMILVPEWNKLQKVFAAIGSVHGSKTLKTRPV